VRRNPAFSEGNRYFLKVGEVTGSIPQYIAEQLLSNPQIRTITQGDTTIIAYGSYDELPQLIKDKIKLSREGITWAIPSYEYASVSPEDMLAREYRIIGARYARRHGAATHSPPPPSYDIQKIPVSSVPVFRIQLGAFREPISKAIFADIDEVSAFRFDDGIIRYYTKAFKSYSEAAQYKAQLLARGYRGIFIVAFKDGKRVSLSEAGVTHINPEKEQESYKQNLSIAASNVKYRVQYGAYTKEIPTEVLSTLLALGDVEKYRENNLTKYLSRPFDKLEDAYEWQKKARESGIKDAFVVADFNGRIVSLSEIKKFIK